MDQNLSSLFQISRTNYYESQDTVAKYYSLSPLDTEKLPYFRFQIMMKNIKKMIQREKEQRDKEKREAEAQAKRNQSKHKSKMK